MNRMGFKPKIILGSLLLLIASLVVTNSFLYANFKDTKVKDIKHIARIKLEKSVANIETSFTSKIGILERSVNFVESASSGEDLLKRLHLIKKLENLDVVFIGYEDGSAWSTDSGKMDPTTYDPRRRDWYKTVRSEMRTIVTNVYADATTGKRIVSIATPIKNGSLLFDVFLDDLQTIVNNLTDNSSVAGIYDDQGKMIVSTGSRDKTGSKLSEYPDLVSLENAILEKHSGTHQYTLDGVDKTAEFMTVKVGNNKKWHILIGMDESVAYKDVAELKTSMVISSLISVFISASLLLTLLNVLYRPVIELKNTIIGLSRGDGDLTQRLEVKSDDDLGEMANGVNLFIKNLQKIMLEIKEASLHLSENAVELKENSSKNTAILKEHVSETEQVVAAVEEMNATAVEVASNASLTAQYTQEADVMARDTLEIVTVAKSSIGDLVDNATETEANVQLMSEETKSISSILDIIGDIAEQTNLLALNAAIEAARAGEQGRGFAVVADEVRNLASRTKVSTTEIEDALQRLLRGNDAVVASIAKTKQLSFHTAEGAEQCGNSIESMSERVTDVNNLNMQVATAAEEQSSVTQELTRNLVTISEMVSEVNERVNKTAMRAENIASVNTQLLSIVDKFKLK